MFIQSYLQDRPWAVLLKYEFTSKAVMVAASRLFLPLYPSEPHTSSSHTHSETVFVVRQSACSQSGLGNDRDRGHTWAECGIIASHFELFFGIIKIKESVNGMNGQMSKTL